MSVADSLLPAKRKLFASPETINSPSMSGQFAIFTPDPYEKSEGLHFRPPRLRADSSPPPSGDDMDADVDLEVATPKATTSTVPSTPTCPGAPRKPQKSFDYLERSGPAPVRRLDFGGTSSNNSPDGKASPVANLFCSSSPMLRGQGAHSRPGGTPCRLLR